jgi:transcriptional regulator GlxA family with amidase domain
MKQSRRLIGILGYEDINALDLIGPGEAFASAEQIDAQGNAQRCYELVVVGIDMRPFKAESGVVFQPATDLQHAPDFDTIIVPGGVGLRSGRCGDAIDLWLRERAPRTRRIASVCTGVYALARAGLLDGRRATTHWRHAQDLRTRFPALTVDADALFVKDGNFYTAAGVSAGIDLALALIEEDCGAQMALSVAREMVVYVKRSGGQIQYSEPLQFQTRAVDVFGELVTWMLAHLDADLSVEALAARVHLGARHFNRRFKEVFDATPADFVMTLRLTEARRRLTQPRSHIDRIATSVGFASAHAFRRAFEKQYGLSPSDYRERFGVRP